MKETEELTQGRVLPHNLEAELQLLGSLLLNNEAIDEVAGILRPEDFYKPAHGIIYKHILKLRDEGESVDIVTLSESLDSSGELEKAGGYSYLSSIADRVAISTNYEEYAKIIREKAILRALILEASKIMNEAYQPQESLDYFFSSVEKRIFDILERREIEKLVEMKDAIKENLTIIEQMMLDPYYRPGIPTHYDKLDQLIYGLQPGNFILLAARPSKGKTSFALNIALKVAAQGYPVLFISLEMPVRDLVNRMIANLAEIPLDSIIRGILSKEYDLPKIYTTADTLMNYDIKFDTKSKTLYEIRAKIRKFTNEIRRKYKDPDKEGLVIIDYLQLLSFGGKFERRELEIAEISRALKNLALELNIPIMALSQLNREVEKRERAEPRLSDLRESGALEQDADLIMFIYDPEEGKKKKSEENFQRADDGDCQRLRIKIAKQRNGVQGNVDFLFCKKFNQFREADY